MTEDSNYSMLMDSERLPSDRPIVSVVLVTCNVERFLAEAIESILAQTFKEFEFIIVDFGSTDSSASIVLGYAARDKRIRFSSIPHCGLGEARNAACFLARGEFIAIMDADDVAIRDRLAQQIDFIKNRPEVGILGGAVEWINRAGSPLRIATNPLNDTEIRIALLERCPFWQPTVLMRRDVFLASGGYREAFAPAEDYDLWLRLAERVKCANLGIVLLKYRIHPYQVSMRKQEQQTLRVMAAQVAARARNNGLSDPFNGVPEITASLLERLGLSKPTQQSKLAVQCQQWIRNVCLAGEYEVALQAALGLLKSDRKFIGRRQIADLQLTVAWLNWKQRRLLQSLLATGRGVLAYPVVVGRPLKRLFGWFALRRPLKTS